jgi:3'(2'), 5'-bisphosphate nucleotidase
VWIIDPVDGTREYGEAREDWAVHVGLAIDGVAESARSAAPAGQCGTAERPASRHTRSRQNCRCAWW